VIFSQAASFDVDAQNGFSPVCPKELPIPEAEQIVPELRNQANFAQYLVGSKDAHCSNAVWVTEHPEHIATPLQEKAANADLYWPRHCEPGTKGFELLEGLKKPSEYDFFVWKGVEPDMHPYGACYHDLANKMSTGVIEFLKKKGVKTVIVGGLATEHCVKHTVLQLLDAQFRVIVNSAACRGLDSEAIKVAKAGMEQKGAIFISCIYRYKYQVFNLLQRCCFSSGYCVVVMVISIGGCCVVVAGVINKRQSKTK